MMQGIEIIEREHNTFIPLECLEFEGSWNVEKMIAVVDEWFEETDSLTVIGKWEDAGASCKYVRTVISHAGALL